MVNDDENDLHIVRELLRETGDGRYHINWASSYDDGLKHVCDGHLDVALVAHRLGGRNGIDFVREVVRRGCKAPIILLTGEEDRAVDFEAMLAGAADFLNKTQLSPEMLERTIRYAVVQRKSEEQRVALLAERAARAELENANKAITRRISFFELVTQKYIAKINSAAPTR